MLRMVGIAVNAGKKGRLDMRVHGLYVNIHRTCGARLKIARWIKRTLLHPLPRVDLELMRLQERGLSELLPTPYALMSSVILRAIHGWQNMRSIAEQC